GVGADLLGVGTRGRRGDVEVAGDRAAADVEEQRVVAHGAGDEALDVETEGRVARRGPGDAAASRLDGEEAHAGCRDAQRTARVVAVCGGCHARRDGRGRATAGP